jgi:hypothetical protein
LPTAAVRRSVAIALSLSLLLAVVGGCGGQSVESFVPSDDLARASLEHALNMWKAGSPAGRIEPEGGGAALQAVDRDWTAGQKLAAFEILDELPREEGPRKFNVRLTLVGGKPIEVVYYVVGKDPMWIFRDRDYAQTMMM